MKPRIWVRYIDHARTLWWAVCERHGLLYAGRSWPDALAAANAHAATHHQPTWHDAAIIESNLRVIRHELETPMRGHVPDGECCRRAANGDDL